MIVSVFYVLKYEIIVYTVRTQRSNSPSPLRTVRFAQFNQAQINIFMREWIKQKERAQPKDKNMEEKQKAMN